MKQLVYQLKTVANDLLWSRKWARRPQQIDFEITAACDARCIHCPRLDMDRPMKAMSMDLFRRMIDQASEMRVPYLCPNGYGEICTLPHSTLEQYLEYMTSRVRPFKILINTNGNRMDAERSSLFIRHQVHLINVTIDGATAKTAESIRLNLSFDKIEANIKELIRLRNAAGQRRPKVRVGMIVMPQNRGEIDQFVARWQGVADYVGMGGFSTRLESVRQSSFDLVPSEGKRPPAPKACLLPFKELSIWADGKAVLCCEDWNEELIVGDLNH
jgi:hypothetical protein